MDAIELISLERDTMPVSRMRKMLGLGRTESYWLLKKGYFKSLTVNGRMRVNISSFEEWYAGQTRYRKVDGPPPGSRIRETAVTVPELAEELQVDDNTVYELIKKGYLSVIQGSCGMMVTRESFQKWYSSQSKFRTAEDRLKEAPAKKGSMTLPEMARLLGVSRNAVYQLMKKVPPGTFVIIWLEGKKRVTADSFERWYFGQAEYHKVIDIVLTDENAGLPLEITAPWKVEDVNAAEQGLAEQEDDAESLSAMMSTKNAAKLLGVHKNTLYTMIESKRIRAVRSGNTYKISRAEIERFMEKETKEEELWQLS